MTRIEYLTEAATLRRCRRDGRITVEEFTHRMAALLSRYSETTEDPWEAHTRTALAVANG